MRAPRREASQKSFNPAQTSKSEDRWESANPDSVPSAAAVEV